MSDNVLNEMTPKQRRAAEALATGATVDAASLAAGVTTRTLHRWRCEASFGAAVRAMASEATTAHQRALTGELAACRAVMVAARDDAEANWPTRLRAANMLEQSLLKWRESVEFEERLLALEERLENEAA